MSVYGTNADPLGGRDRLGVHGMQGGFESDNDNVNEINTTTSEIMYHKMKDSFKVDKELIFEKKKIDNSKLLDTNQLKDLDN
jgi:hypothetical protein